MRALSIVLGVMLVLSLAGNAVLGFVVFDFNRQIISMQENLNQKQSRINQVTIEKSDSDNQVKTLRQEVANLTYDLDTEVKKVMYLENKHKEELSKYKKFYNRAICPNMVVNQQDWVGLNTKKIIDLLEPSIMMTYFLSPGGGMQVKRIFSDRDDALIEIFTRTEPRNSIQYVVTFRNKTDIQTIYDMQLGCIVYTGSRPYGWEDLLP